MPYVPLKDGKHLYVRVIGKGKPCVMLHGFAMNSLHWLTAILPLCRQYQFIMPDFRGFGESRHLNPTQSDVVAHFASDTEDVIEWVGQDVALVGISMGAMTALRYNELYQFKGVTRYLHIDQSPRIMLSLIHI